MATTTEESSSTRPTTQENNEGLHGLVAAVEGKMAELMAWHGKEKQQLEADRAAMDRQQAESRIELNDQRTRLEQEREHLSRQAEGLDRERSKLLDLAKKLESEQAALTREWANVERVRDLNNQLAEELKQQREQSSEKLADWLGETQSELDQPLQLAKADSSDSAESSSTPRKAKAKKAA